MLSTEDNNLLTRVEKEAPMGQLLREYWVPALRSARLEPNGAPVRVRLFGENFVAFRAEDGRVGFLDEGCPHRGVSLALARNEDCALRCIFHGWKIDVSGKVVETPSEPGDSDFASKIRVNHYPVQEAGKLVWVYLGKEDTPPIFPNFEFNNLPDANVLVIGAITNANWFQSLEGALDSSHLSILHSNLIPKSPTADITAQSIRNDSRPRYEMEQQPYGITTAAIRNAPDGRQYVRVSQFVAPWYSIVPVAGGSATSRLAFAFVPIDDTHTQTWVIHSNVKEPVILPARLAQAFYGTPTPDPDNFYNWGANSNNLWGQDRQKMQEGHFSGILGITPEDFACQEGQGPIADRSKETLGQSDIAIIQTRKLMLAAARAFQEGKPAFSLDQNIDYSKIMAVSAVVEANEDWRNSKTLEAVS